MPDPLPDPAVTGPVATRRTVLVGLVGGATAACSPYSLQTQERRPSPPGVSPTATPSAPPEDPDVPLAATVLAAEQEMVDRVDATVRRHPRLSRVLEPVRAVHQAHVEMLDEAAPEDGSTPEGADSRALRREVPRDRTRALRGLAVREDELSLTDKRSAFAAQSGAFARVLASMAAAAAQQAALLRTTRGGRS